MTGLLLLGTSGIIAISVVCALVALLLIFLLVYMGMYNKLQRLKNLTEEGWATIDVQLKKRYDLIPNLVETVKGYAKHESETLEKVIAARNAAMTATGNEKMAAENVLTGTLKSLFALQEAYPQLKANTNFTDLQSQLSRIETELASARRYYNATVKELNTKIDVFPSNLVARKMRLEKRVYFELDSAEERVAPSVKF